jgi:hypothetical protein
LKIEKPLAQHTAPSTPITKRKDVRCKGPQTIGADREGKRAEGPDGRCLHQDADQFEHDLAQGIERPVNRCRRISDHRHGNPEQDGHEQRLQDVALGEGADEGGRDDTHEEADDGRLMRGGGILGNRSRVQRRGVDVQSTTRLDHIGDNKADDQGEGREKEEIGEGLARHPPNLPEIPHSGDARGDRQKDHRGDDHLDQFDKGVTQRLQAFAEIRPEMTNGPARHDRQQHNEVQAAIERLAHRGSTGSGGWLQQTTSPGTATRLPSLRRSGWCRSSQYRSPHFCIKPLPART